LLPTRQARVLPARRNGLLPTQGNGVLRARDGVLTARRRGHLLTLRCGAVLLGAGHPGVLDGRLNLAVFPPPRDGDRNGETPLATGLLHLAPPGPVSCAHRTSSPHRAASTTVSATRRSLLARPGRCATSCQKRLIRSVAAISPRNSFAAASRSGRGT